MANTETTTAPGNSGLRKALLKASARLLGQSIKDWLILCVALVMFAFITVAILTPAAKLLYFFAIHYWNWLP
jgi:hypothetical protein